MHLRDERELRVNVYVESRGISLCTFGGKHTVEVVGQAEDDEEDIDSTDDQRKIGIKYEILVAEVEIREKSDISVHVIFSHEARVQEY